MPGGPADTLQLYHPMTLQSVPNNNHHSSSYSGSSTRHMVSNMPPRSHNLNGDYAPSSRHMGMYASGQGSGSGHTSGHYMSSEVGPLSAPPSLSSGNPFSSHNSHHHHSSGGQYPSLLPSPRSSGHHSTYFNDAPSHSNSNGSGYGTPP